MSHDTSLAHLVESLANQCVLVRVQLDVIVDRLVDEIASRPILSSGQRIQGIDFIGSRAKAHGFLGATHNLLIIPSNSLYYKRTWKSYAPLD